MSAQSDGASYRHPNSRSPEHLFDRLFFAVFPDPEVASCLATRANEIRVAQAIPGRLLQPHRLHVTLRLVCNTSRLMPVVVDAARCAGDRIQHPRFDVAFNAVSSFSRRPGQAACVLHGGRHGALHVLHRELGRAMSEVGLSAPDTGRFRPHMTFLYGDPIAGTRPTTPVRWMPREFVLVHSLVGLTEHRVLGRWPLTGWW